jgi:hypothetical protein
MDKSAKIIIGIAIIALLYMLASLGYDFFTYKP